MAVSGTSPASGEGAVKSLEADGLRRPQEALSCTGDESVQVGEDGVSLRSQPWHPVPANGLVQVTLPRSLVPVSPVCKFVQDSP